MKILTHNYPKTYYKNYSEYNKKPCAFNDIPQYKKEISNICYRPAFTSKREMSDKDFFSKLQIIQNRLYSYKTLNCKDVEEALTYINKDNIHIAEKLSKDEYGFANGDSINLLQIINSDNNDIADFILYTGRFDRRGIDINEVIETVNQDNQDFAMQLLSDKEFVKINIEGILKYTNKKTLPLAQYLYEHNYNNTRFYFEDLLKLYNEDSIASFAQICRTNYLAMHEEYPKDIAQIVSKDIKPEDMAIMEYLYNSDYIGRKASKDIFEIINSTTLPIFKTIAEYNAKAYDMVTNMEVFNANDKYLKEQNIGELIERVKHQKALVDKAPEKYITSNDLTMLTNRYLDWEVHTPEDVQRRFFTTKFVELMIVASLLDKESMDVLFRQRTNAVQKFTEKVAYDMTAEDLNLLKQLIKSKNKDGQKHSSAEKIELVDLFKIYKSSNINLNNMQNMISEDRVDINELKKDLYKYTMSLAGIGENIFSQIPQRKLYGWDINNIHLIANELANPYKSKPLKDLIFAATTDNFKDYIEDCTNIYGNANSNTKLAFKCYGLDYKKWVNPSPSNNIVFRYDNSNKNPLKPIVDRITEDMEVLRSSHPEMKKFIDRSFPKCIKAGNFVVPNEYTKSRVNLDRFTNGLLNGMQRIWKKAEKTLSEQSSFDNSKIAIENSIQAQNTLTIKNHLKLRLKEINNCSNDAIGISKPLDITIKMWDRNPQKDLFQGNYSTCCIGIGKTNGHFMPQYLLNTAFNMIEMVDNKSGTTIGNALCYFANDNNGKQVFVIDNVEINRNHIPSEISGIKLRNAIKQYAQNITQEVSGKSDMPIILGTHFNDIPTKDLKNAEHLKLNMIGDIATQQIYLDVYGGAIPKTSIYGNEVKALYI